MEVKYENVASMNLFAHNPVAGDVPAASHRTQRRQAMLPNSRPFKGTRLAAQFARYLAVGVEYQATLVAAEASLHKPWNEGGSEITPLSDRVAELQNYILTGIQ